MSERVADWIEAALGAAQSPDCTIIVDESREANLRWANNAVTSNGDTHDRSATVIAFDGPRTAAVSGPLADAAELIALVARAEAALVDAVAAPDAMPLLDGGRDTDFAEPADAADFSVLAGFAAELGDAFQLAVAEGQLLFGFAEHRLTTTWLAASTGTRRRHVQPMGRVELNAKLPDLIGSAWVGVATLDFTDVSVPGLYAEARRRLGWSARRIDLPAGRYETLLPPSAIADLLIYAYWSMSAHDAAEGRNAFADPAAVGRTRIGQRLSELPLTLASDPAAPGLERAPFVIAHVSAGGEQSVFDNGAPVERAEWLADGVLTDLVRDRRVAADQGLSPRPATWNLLLTGGGDQGLDEMIADTRRGLLLTCLWYIREVDPETLLLTGLTRDGVYLIEDGEVVGAVNNFRFNESPISLLGRISEAGRSEQTLPREWNDWLTLTVMPPVRVPDFNMSTVSQAH
ncbi:peptidase [Enemella evansiae]|uniref:Peptidase n=1 Tax=Enemella evansiae TaxID=2016499 RepID=A0A255G1X0_9ACTN|nr:metallopeptidase TldD-related protein [Enemella evansiae]OYO09571.1 peptidase [Enemella evansiae]